jgi:hypothetical protein
MVVDVGLASMLFVHVLVRLMGMRLGCVVVLMTMCRSEMDPFFARALVVRDMPVLVGVDQTLMPVLLCHR